jgi:GTPase involved in cell partitioning and DNA repair
VAPGSGGKFQNQVDHICISQRWKKLLLDVRNKRGAEIGSDHHLIIGELRFHITHQKRKMMDRRKYDVDKLKQNEVQGRFKERLRAEAVVVRDIKEDTVENRWQVIKTTLQNISESVLGYVTSERKEWISAQSWEKIEKKKRAKGQTESRY